MVGEILDEMKRAILEHRADLAEERLDALIAMMEEAFPEAMVEGFEPTAGAMPVHPGDRHVLAAAVAGKADLLVTANVRHFPGHECARLGVRVVTPDAFLTSLLEADQCTVMAVLREASLDTSRPHLSMADVLDRLSGSAPCFARKARELLSA